MSSHNLAKYDNTGFFQSSVPKSGGGYWKDDTYAPVIIRTQGTQQIIWIHINRLENPEALITEYQITFQCEDEMGEKEVLFVSTKAQISSLRKMMGLNISEIAEILHVSRPTIYGWVDSEISLRNDHQVRLNDIYDICVFWTKKEIGYLTTYLHKKSNNQSKSLFMMLSEKKLDIDNIYYLLDRIEQLILEEKKKKTYNEKLLNQHGFENISEEELEKNFNSNIQIIG